MKKNNDNAETGPDILHFTLIIFSPVFNNLHFTDVTSSQIGNRITWANCLLNHIPYLGWKSKPYGHIPYLGWKSQPYHIPYLVWKSKSYCYIPYMGWKGKSSIWAEKADYIISPIWAKKADHIISPIWAEKALDYNVYYSTISAVTHQPNLNQGPYL